MKKTELKNILKPLIKKCIKEVLLEEGILSNIVAEVVSGVKKVDHLTESKNRSINYAEISQKDNRRQEKLDEMREKMLDAIGQNSYNGVNLFEGTDPMRAEEGPNHSPLSDQDPRDAGIDISFIPGANNWSKLIK